MLTNLDTTGIFFARDRRADEEELKRIADCLEALRMSDDIHPGVSQETRKELKQYLALAEAALRRAHAEGYISSRTGSA